MSAVVSDHEKALAGVTAMVALYAVLFLFFGKQLTPDYWRRLGEERKALADRREEQRALIAQEAEWRRQYESLRDMMPVFPPDRRVDTYWGSVMDKVAGRHGVSIGRRQFGEEAAIGDAYEMPIVCKDFEATLDGFVRFLYDLHAEGAMLDIRQMYVKPTPNNPGKLRGDFTLYCAYLRGEGEIPPAAPEAAPDAAATP